MSRAQQVKSSRIFHQPLWRKATWMWPFTTSLNPVAAIISSSGWSQPPEGGLGILASPKEPGSKSKGRLYQRAKWTLHMHIMPHLKWSYRSSDWWEVRVCCQVLPQFLVRNRSHLASCPVCAISPASMNFNWYRVCHASRGISQRGTCKVVSSKAYGSSPGAKHSCSNLSGCHRPSAVCSNAVRAKLSVKSRSSVHRC